MVYKIKNSKQKEGNIDMKKLKESYYNFVSLRTFGKNYFQLDNKSQKFIRESANWDLENKNLLRKNGI